MAVYAYLRVSTIDQNLDRQRVSLKKYCDSRNITDCIIINEKISGFNKKTTERKINLILNDKNLNHLIIHEISRLGRRFIDVVTTLDKLKERGVKVTILSLGIESFLENGQVNPTFSLITSVLANLAETMYLDDKAKKQAGIEIAKSKGKYKGRKKGTTESKDKFLAKYKNVVRLLNYNLSVRKTAAAAGVSVSTVMKVKSYL